MGKNGKAMHAFIEDISDSKLVGGFCYGTIYTGHKNFRLDLQGLTTTKDGEPQKYNIQMQVNNRPAMTSLEAMAPDTVATVQVPLDEPYTAAQIKAMLLADLVRNKH